MAEKYLGTVGTQRLWERITQLFVRKDGNKVLSDNNFSDADKAKLDSLQPVEPYVLPIASDDTLGGVKIGAGINRAADGTISVDLAPGGTVEWSDVANTPTTLDGYGIQDAATKQELEDLAAKVTSVFKFKGSVSTRADLDNIQDPETGDVYNVTEDGMDFAWDGEAWDALGGIIDLSGYWAKDELVELTADEIDIITGSATTPAAFKEILAEGNEATLVSDLTFNEELTITKSFELDLGGKTLTYADNGCLFRVGNGGELTIKGAGNVVSSGRLADITEGGTLIIEDGTFTVGDVCATAHGANAKIVMNGGSITAVEGGLGALDQGELEINGGNINITDNFALFTNGTNGRGGNTITMNGGNMIGNITSNGFEACGVYIANNDTFIMNGGSIVANGGVGLLQRAGTVVINDGYIEGKVSANRPAGSVGHVGDSKTDVGQAGIIYQESANYPGKEGMSLTINGGEIKGVTFSVETLSNEVDPKVYVNGGTFDPEYIPVN